MHLQRIGEISVEPAYQFYKDYQDYARILKAYSALEEGFADDLILATTRDPDVVHQIILASKPGEPFAVRVFGETYRFVLEAKYSGDGIVGVVTCQVFDRLQDTYRSLGWFDLRDDGKTSIMLSVQHESLYLRASGGSVFQLILGVARAYMSGQFGN